MKSIIIFGASKNGYRVKKELEKYTEYQVAYFCDNNEKKQGQELDGIKILSFSQVEELYRGGSKLEIVVAIMELDTIINQIRDSKVRGQVYGLTREFLMEQANQYGSINQILYDIDVEKPRLDYFEYHVSHHCNLKCKGCGHFSNIAPIEFGDLAQYTADIHRLKELFWGVKRIRLMGGEPLLNPQLPEFIRITREVFPDSNIRVVTNGLLIPTVDKKVFDTMSKCYVGFDISHYPPTDAIKETIEFICLENNVEYSMSKAIITNFFDSLNLQGDSQKDINYEICISKKCHFLCDGKISTCGGPILYKKYESMLNYRIELNDDDINDIYNPHIDGFQLLDRLTRPIEQCRYCDNANLKTFDWKGHYTQLLERGTK